MMACLHKTQTSMSNDARAQRGFTFAETMVALLIFVLLSAFVANGIPVAFSTYQKVTTTSNAHVALSTTASALRDELGLAVAVKGNGADLRYLTGDGYWIAIDNGPKGLQKHYYAGGAMGPTGDPVGDPIPLIPDATIVGAIGVEDLKVVIPAGGITYDDATGVFMVTGLKAESTSTGLSIDLVRDEDGNNKYEIKTVLKPPRIP